MRAMDITALAKLPEETLKQWLSDALSAQHQLRTGAKLASATVNGRVTTYTQAQAASLSEYVEALQSAIEAKQSGATGMRSPIRMW